MLYALQAPMQVETKLRDKACSWVMRTIAVQRASLGTTALCTVGGQVGKQADWVLKQSSD